MPVTAIVLAAGEGTRMKSRHPKVTHKVLDRPLAWWVVDAARRAGIERIVVVVGNGADEVRSCLAGEGDVEFVEQAERLGTGHAVRVVKDALGGFTGPVVVLNGDLPLVRPKTISALVDATRANHSACTILTMTPPDATGYGRIVTEDGQVRAIIEHKDCTPAQREELREPAPTASVAGGSPTTSAGSAATTPRASAISRTWSGSTSAWASPSRPCTATTTRSFWA